MRRLVLLAGAVALAGTLAGPPQAGASVAAKDVKFCAAVKKLPSEIDALPADADGVDRKAAASTARKIRKAAESAPRKVRKAMITMSRLYDRLADGDSITEVLSEETIDFAKAAATFTAYFAKNCVALPDITTP